MVFENDMFYILWMAITKWSMTQLLILISTEGSEFKIITQDDIELIKEKEKKQGLACENSFC